MFPAQQKDSMARELLVCFPCFPATSFLSVEAALPCYPFPLRLLLMEIFAYAASVAQTRSPRIWKSLCLVQERNLPSPALLPNSEERAEPFHPVETVGRQYFPCHAAAVGKRFPRHAAS